MGHVSIVYGNIIGGTWSSADFHKLHRMNKAIIDALPEKDNHFPWMERRMFSVPDPDRDRIYREQVIVFGASYKEVEQEWEEWLEKFESILRQLYWFSATVHLDSERAGTHTFEWIFDVAHTDSWATEAPLPITKWKFFGGPRQFI